MIADERALLNAIIAAPDDDLPRLVYADWLEEQGRSEGAEFIRLQCELARVGFDPARRRRLRKRIRQWQYRHGDRWRQELPSDEFAVWGEDYDRGFVNSITVLLSPEPFRPPPNKVFKYAPLQVVQAILFPTTREEITTFLNWPGLLRFEQLVFTSSGPGWRLYDQPGGDELIPAIARHHWGERPAVLDLSYFWHFREDDLSLLASVPTGRTMPRLILRPTSSLNEVTRSLLRQRYGN
jgi:uncharacterized protein (TIGR02996 family)